MFDAICITADDLPHIGKEEIEKVKKEFSGYPEFAESVLGYNFLPLVQDSVISGKALEDVLANPPAFRDGPEVHVFCDFAWGNAGDENVVAIRRSNRVNIAAHFHCGHLVSTLKNPEPGIIERFEQEFLKLGLYPTDSHLITGDEGGGGKLVLDALESRGWYLNRVNNGFPAVDSDHYANVAAETWFEGAKLITGRAVILPNDRTMRSQLLNRKRRRNDKGKLAVETKEEMKKRGVNSPDRADAVLGAMTPSGGLHSGVTSWAKALPMGKYQPLFS